jgi:small basic protein (TIGR04137 family)
VSSAKKLLSKKNEKRYSPDGRKMIYYCLTFRTGEEKMSQHRSLRGSSKITSKRNVLKRFERVNLLQKRGDWKEGDRGLGLKKTKPEA